MWTVVYIAPNGNIAENLKTVLEMEGILVRLRAIGVPHKGESSSGSVEILVPESEVDEAMEVLNSSVR